MNEQPKKKALGKGLGALLTTKAATFRQTPPELQLANPGEAQSISIEAIKPNPLQPRSIFHQQALDELAQSIRANGIIQPLVVRTTPNGTELIAGERRLRAAKLAGLSEVPVVYRQISNERLLEITLIENIQREDLNPLEVAEAYQRLTLDLGLSHEQIAERTGKDRSTITNHLRLLRLPQSIQQLLADRRLSMGHARALVAIESEEDQVRLANAAAAESLSVREMERMTRELASKNRQVTGSKQKPEGEDPNWKAAIQKLQEHLGTKVQIQARSKGKGKLEIDFYSEADLQRIYDILMGNEH